jgi:hypothetical protein
MQMKFNFLGHQLLKTCISLCIGVFCLISFSYGQFPDSVIVPASIKYINCSPVRLLFIGKNYRREWSTPVKMPVFNLKKERGGFTIKELGGGQQTKSLRLLDKKGEEWVLRSTDKDVAGALAATLKNKFASNLVKDVIQDLISASHPYGSLTVPDLAKAAGVVVARPKLFYVPDDPALGEYRSLFANTVCFLEDREPTADQSETESTEDVMEKVFEKNDHQLIQQTILKARLLDMLIADWDRHEDQWKWGIQKKGSTTWYYPVPKDRDFAYFKSNGLIVLFASITVLPHMHSFTRDGSALKKLSNKTWEMDAQWLNQLNEEDWENAIIQFQNKLTDSVIKTAVKNIPPEVHAISGKKLEEKLMNRRNGLLKHAMDYYRFLAFNTYIIGTDEQEFFTIGKDEDNITVTASRNGSKDKNQIIYQRTFNQKDTKKIHIMGLGGNDHFDIDENVSSSIKLHLEGGKGNDVYSVKGKIKTTIEDDDNNNKSKPVLTISNQKD